MRMVNSAVMVSRVLMYEGPEPWAIFGCLYPHSAVRLSFTIVSGDRWKTCWAVLGGVAAALGASDPSSLRTRGSAGTIWNSG